MAVEIPNYNQIAQTSIAHEIATSATDSTYTFKTNTYDFGAGRFRITLTTVPMHQSEGRKWEAFFASVRTERVVYRPNQEWLDYAGRTQSPGNPIIQNDTESGDVLLMDNFDTSRPVVFSAGTYFHVFNIPIGEGGSQCLYQLVNDVKSVDGEMQNVRVFPPVRVPIRNGQWVRFGPDPNGPQHGDEDLPVGGEFYLMNQPILTYNSDNILQPVTFELAQL